MEKITLIGNVGNDAKLVEYQGNKFLDFSIASTKKIKNGNETKEITNWYDCNFDNIKIAEYLKKGTKVYIEGNFKLDTFYSEKMQKHIPKINVYVRVLELLSAKKED